MARMVIDFMSEAIKRPVTIGVVVPGDHMLQPTWHLPEMNKPYQTLYVMEGVLGNSIGPLNYSMLQAIAEDNNIVVVTIGGENKWYAEHSATGEKYAEMIAKDIINFTRRTFNLSDKREDTFVGGFSMGGYGALRIGLAYPELFSKIIALSSATNKQAIMEAPNDWDMYTVENYCSMFSLKDPKDYENSEDDYEYLARRTAALGKEMMPKIFMGRGELDENTKDTEVAFGQYLVDLGYDVTRVTYPGAHNYIAYNHGMEAGIKWLGVDSFNNMYYYGLESGVNAENWIHWKTWYNIEAENK